MKFFQFICVVGPNIFFREVNDEIEMDKREIQSYLPEAGLEERGILSHQSDE
jgi:hypothetical protein